jgi:hypothetical protein
MARTVRVGGATKVTLPAIGLGMASHGEPLSDRELQLLGGLGPRHLRQDVHLDAPGWADDLARAQMAASRLGCALELALLSAEPADPGLLAGRLGEGPLVAHVLALAEGAEVTSVAWLDAARGAVGEPGRDALFAVGSNANFTELNRAWDRVQGVRAVVYPLNPQVHAFDDRSLTETLPVQGLTVQTARARAPGAAVVVSPVTLRPRFNAVAGGGGGQTAPAAELPPSVDVRQPSLLAAGWTLGSLSSLAAAGVAACTYFETTGWRGVLERDAGPPLPDRFPSRPGMAFPVYHVLADALEASPSGVLATDISGNEPPSLAALALRARDRVVVLLANLGPEPQQVTVNGLADAPVRARAVDERSAAEALLDPLAFRATGEPLEVRSGELEVELRPYAYLRVDQPEGRA